MSAPVTRYRVVPFVEGDVVNEAGIAMPPYSVLAGTAKWLLLRLRQGVCGPLDGSWTSEQLCDIARRTAGTSARTSAHALTRLLAGGYLVAVEDEEVR